jgi:DNA invertase Pin-like site-specific DNA recombinase
MKVTYLCLPLTDADWRVLEQLRDRYGLRSTRMAAAQAIRQAAAAALHPSLGLSLLPSVQDRHRSPNVTPDGAVEIRRRLAAGVPAKAVAIDLGVSVSTIYRIQKARRAA